LEVWSRQKLWIQDPFRRKKKLQNTNGLGISITKKTFTRPVKIVLGNWPTTGWWLEKVTIIPADRQEISTFTEEIL